MKITTHNEDETIKLGERLAKQLKSGDILCLLGDLGAGKTTFTKGVAKGLRIAQAKVNSPTFVLMNIYDGKLPLYHFDLYRLDGEDQISLIGYDEFLYGDGIAVIEWADRLGELTPEDYLEVSLEHKKDSNRAIKIIAKGKRYKDLLKKL